MVAAVNTADLVAGARALIEPLTGHTPGEWEMSVTHPTNACANVRCGYTDVATLYGGDSDVPQPADDEPWGPQPIRDANARLTAAAPALRDTVAALADLADAQAQEIERLKDENERLRKTLKPEWFYPADGYESEACRWSVGEVLNEDYFSDLPKTGQHVVEINVATPLPSIWAAVRFTCECADPDKCECDNDMIVTEHASEAEARAALQADEAAQ